METSSRVALNGQQLDELDEHIVIKSISESAAKNTIKTVGIGRNAGSRLTQNHRDYYEITVDFFVSVYDDAVSRTEVIDKISEWASEGGWLTTNYREAKRIRVSCETLPSLQGAWATKNDFSMTFRAYEVPYWQNESPETIQKTSGRLHDGIVIGGNVRTPAWIEAKNVSGSTINNIDMFIGDTKIQLGRLGLLNGETFELGYTDDGLQYMRIRNSSGGTRSVMANRGWDSNDCLWIRPGGEQFQLNAESGRSIQWTLSAYGRWL